MKKIIPIALCIATALLWIATRKIKIFCLMTATISASYLWIYLGSALFNDQSDPLDSLNDQAAAPSPNEGDPELQSFAADKKPAKDALALSLAAISIFVFLLSAIGLL